MPAERSHQEAHALGSRERLEGKIAIITGGARGIGEATARLFARHGAKVIIADIDVASGEQLASHLSPSVTFCRCDVTQESDVEHVINSTLSRYGRVDVVFNNAGVLGSQAKHRRSIVEFDPDEFDRVMHVNVRGVALGMKHAARVMIPRRSGCIISTASVAGVIGGLGPHTYTATKHAIIGLTKNAACELGAYGIRVNCISPFGVATSMLLGAWRSKLMEEDQEEEEVEMEDGIPTGRLRNPSAGEVDKMDDFIRSLGSLRGQTLRPKDIAEAALYLAGEESKYVSGHNLVVDGGVTIARNFVEL